MTTVAKSSDHPSPDAEHLRRAVVEPICTNANDDAPFGQRSIARDLFDQRLSLFEAVAPAFNALAQRLGHITLNPHSLWHTYLPLAHHLAKVSRNMRGCFVVGIAGPPGAGKTTLTEILELILSTGFRFRTLRIGSDDLYLPRVARAALGQKWRGPDTLDIEAARTLLEIIRKGGERFDVPRYDLALDDRTHIETCHGPYDILLLEGWLIGKVIEDAFGERQKVLDYLIFLDAELELLKDARLTREEAIRTNSRNENGLSREEMMLFWSECIAPGVTKFTLPLRAKAHLVMVVDSWHQSRRFEVR